MKANKLLVTAVQKKFLQMVTFQLKKIFDEMIEIRAVRFDKICDSLPTPDETVFTFSDRVIDMIRNWVPEHRHFIIGKRSLNTFNLGPLIDLKKGKHILVVNDTRNNTDETVYEVSKSEPEHTYIPYYPGSSIPDNIDIVLTAGEKEMVPPEFQNIIDIGLRVISIKNIFEINKHFNLKMDPEDISNRYMKSMMHVSREWPALGYDRYLSSWVGTIKDMKAKFRFSDLVAHSSSMQELINLAEMMAVRKEPIHLYGELGTGKMRIAQAIHNRSRFRKGPFLYINCAARTPDILEKELFGWEENGTIYPGLFESARRGTLCIMEIKKVPPILQPKIVQALSEKRIIRREGTFFVDIDTRVITTSSSRLDSLSDTKFHKELYFLLSQLSLRVPSLIDRNEDFEELIHHYLVGHLNRKDIHLDKATINILKKHSWKGNVQELYNVLLHIAFGTQGAISPNQLPFYITGEIPAPSGGTDKPDNLETIIKSIEETGFLDESVTILEIYLEGKKQNKSYGRALVQEKLGQKSHHLSWNQLRLRLERLAELGLLKVRVGRAGTTISRKGDWFLKEFRQPNLMKVV